MIKIVRVDENLMITMANTMEHFLITDANYEVEEEIEKWSKWN